MTDILVGEIGDAHDRTFLDGPQVLLVLIHADIAHLEAPCFVFLDDLRFVDLDLLHVEGTAKDIDIVAHVLL